MSAAAATIATMTVRTKLAKYRPGRCKYFAKTSSTPVARRSVAVFCFRFSGNISRYILSACKRIINGKRIASRLRCSCPEYSVHTSGGVYPKKKWSRLERLGRASAIIGLRMGRFAVGFSGFNMNIVNFFKFLLYKKKKNQHFFNLT